MSAQSLHHSGRPHLSGAVGLTLVMPTALALYLLFRPSLGLPNLSQASDCRQPISEACADANLQQDMPDTPRPDMDAPRIYLTRIQYHYLAHCRRLTQTLRRSAHAAQERLFLQQQIAQGNEDYRRLYHEITPAGRRQAHLPRPEED